jgi:hypothetical protein
MAAIGWHSGIALGHATLHIVATLAADQMLRSQCPRLTRPTDYYGSSWGRRLFGRVRPVEYDQERTSGYWLH